MLWRHIMKIGKKMKLSLFTVAVAATILAILVSYLASRQSLMRALSDHLSTTARSRANHIETLLDGYKSRMALYAKDHRIQAFLRAIAKQDQEEKITAQELDRVLREFTDESWGLASMLVLDSKGTVVGSSDHRYDTMNMSHSPCFLRGRQALCVEDAFQDKRTGVGVFSIAAPVMEQQQLLGVVVTRINMNRLNKITSARTGLGKTGEIYIVNHNGYMITRSRFVKDSFLKQKVDTEITRKYLHEVTAQSRRKNLQTAAIYPSYTGARVIGLYAPIEDVPWCLCAEISRKEALVSLTTLEILAFMILCAASMLAWMIGDVTSCLLTKPIKKLQRGVQQFSQGNLECRVGTEATDEIGDLSRSFDEMAENLQTSMTSVETLNHEIERRKQTEESLKVAKDQAEIATALKSEFLANVSHEIRTPMNAIIGFTQLLKEESLEKEQVEFLEIVEDCCNKLLKLINDLLDLSKIEAGKMDIKRNTFPLKKLLCEMESLLKPLAKAKKLDLKVTVQETVPAVLCSDSDRLYQCLVNLAENAIKFTEKGHVRVTVSTMEYEGQSFVRFDVEDTGPGIAPDKQRYVFDPFIQIDGSMTRMHGGTGLGLTLVKHLVELLGGHIILTSTEGVGSKFSIAVPLSDVNEPPERLNDQEDVKAYSCLSPEELQATAEVSCKIPSRILVVEDNLTNRELMRIILEKMGHDVLLANDGIEAVEKVVANSIDLIFMDMQMPRMSGYDATREIKEKDILIPVIALTAHAMKGDRIKCLEAGCDDYISKPIDYQEIVNMLNKYLPAATESQRTKPEEIIAE